MRGLMSGSLNYLFESQSIPLLPYITKAASISVSDTEATKILQNGDAWLLSAPQAGMGQTLLRGMRCGKPFKL